MVGQRPIPKDTAGVLTDEVLGNCRNLGLLLDKFNPWERYTESGRALWDMAFRIHDRQRSVAKRGGEAKGLWLSDRQDDGRTKLLDEPLLRRSHIDIVMLDAYRTRWEQLVAHHGADKNSGLRFDLQTTSRLIVGLGSESVLEMAITLHRIHGFPVIPGSALKGLTRTWALLKLAATLGVPALDYEQFQAYKGSRAENKRPTPLNRLESMLEGSLDIDDETRQGDLQDNLEALKREQPVQGAGGDILTMELADFRSNQGVQDFRNNFGYLGQAGAAVFFDAVPVREPRFVADVMNVHYPDYYRDGEGQAPPSDDQHPKPLPFLAVAEGSLFRFAVGGRRRNNPDDLICAKKARVWLEEALCEAVIGAKTTSGYGCWNHTPSSRSPQDRPQRPEDLELGQVLIGTVLNTTPFGAFVDIGVGRDGLVHISELSEGYVGSVDAVVQIGQRVQVKVLSVEQREGKWRISLTMKDIE
jgi:CRISPR-associated protein Cmr6